MQGTTVGTYKFEVHLCFTYNRMHLPQTSILFGFPYSLYVLYWSIKNYICHTSRCPLAIYLRLLTLIVLNVRKLVNMVKNGELYQIRVLIGRSVPGSTTGTANANRVLAIRPRHRHRFNAFAIVQMLTHLRCCSKPLTISDHGTIGRGSSKTIIALYYTVCPPSYYNI